MKRLLRDEKVQRQVVKLPLAGQFVLMVLEHFECSTDCENPTPTPQEFWDKSGSSLMNFLIYPGHQFELSLDGHFNPFISVIFMEQYTTWNQLKMVCRLQLAPPPAGKSTTRSPVRSQLCLFTHLQS